MNSLSSDMPTTLRQSSVRAMIDCCLSFRRRSTASRRRAKLSRVSSELVGLLDFPYRYYTGSSLIPHPSIWSISATELPPLAPVQARLTAAGFHGDSNEPGTFQLGNSLRRLRLDGWRMMECFLNPRRPRVKLRDETISDHPKLFVATVPD